MTGLDADGEAEARVYVNGVEVDDSPQSFPEMDDGSAWNTYLGSGESGTAHLLTGALDDVRVYQGALSAEEIVDLVNNVPSGAPFDIIQVTRTPSEITMEWNSRPGRTYLVEFNPNPADPVWIEIDDGVQSEGTVTGFTDDDPNRLALPQAYYRVGDN